MPAKIDLKTQAKPAVLGVLGGSFDPVHLGHLTLAREAKNRFGLDRVIFVPAFHSPHKLDREMAAAHHRLQMLRLALAGNPEFEVSQLELERRGPSYTIDTLDTLCLLHPACKLNLIMGIDTFRAIHTWKESTRLLTACNLLVSTRPGHTLSPLETLIGHLSGDGGIPPYPLPPSTDEGLSTFLHREGKTRLVFFPIPPVNASSSEIRRRIRAGLETRIMLPPEVENYIIENRLYRTGFPPQAG